MKSTSRMSKALLGGLVLLLVLAVAAPARAATLTIDFDSVPVNCSGFVGDPTAYLAGFGITLSYTYPVSQVAQLLVGDDRGIYDTCDPTPSVVQAPSPHNIVTQGGSNGPITFTLHFSTPLESFAFTRVLAFPGAPPTSHPAWAAAAFDADDNEIASVSEGFSLNGTPATFTLSAASPSITQVTFFRDGTRGTASTNTTAFGHVLTDNWVLTGPCAGVVCSSVCAQCNPANGLCDQGNPASAGTVCRASAGDCDVAESCTGSSATCPDDAFLSSATVCLASAGECDPQETCTGSSATCPGDAKSPNGTACTSDGNPCTLDQCDGSSALCQHPAGNAGAVCHASAGECDPQETCTGSSTTCPADVKSPAGTACTSDGNPCTLDQCNGSSNACQHPAGNAGAVCRAATDACDAAETCTGSSATCPTDGFQASGTACGDPTDTVCNHSDTCNGAGSCQTNNEPDGTICNDSNACTVNDACSAGSCVGSQVTCFGMNATICGDNGNNVIIGTNGPDVIHGLGGNDKICGGDGNDLLFGGSGNDKLDGGSGFDVCIGGFGNDTATNCEVSIP